MVLSPQNADEKLGFGVLRDRLLEYVLSPYGRDEVVGSRPSADLDHVRRELGAVSEVQRALTFDDPIPFRALEEVRHILREVAPEGSHANGGDLVLLLDVLQTLRLTTEYWRRRSDTSPLTAARCPQVGQLREVEEAISRVLDERGEVRDDASPELRRIRRDIGKAQTQLREALHRELRSAVSNGFATEEQPTVRGGRMVIPIRTEAKRKIAGFVHDTSATGQTVYLEPAACLDLNNEVRELESAERQEVVRILRETTAAVRERLPRIGEGIAFLGWFDFVLARARLAADMDASVPELNERCEIVLRDARNPALMLHFQRTAADSGGTVARDVVPMDIELGERLRTVVITGPNAGGKTVAMKTVGLLSLMLGHGMPLPAHPSSRVGLFHRVFVDIGDEQSIEEDLSTFSSHLENLNRMLGAADECTLVLIDEAGTGTDPQEGAALARAVLEALTDVGARTIATTHHGALKSYAHETAFTQNASMAFDEETLRPTYRFRSGVPGSSYAFPIARRQGLPSSVLERAASLLGTQQTSFDALIESFQSRTAEMEHTIEALEATRRQAERERLRFAERLDALQQERSEIMSRALAHAERVVAEANATVERTIREIREAQAERDRTRHVREDLETLRGRLLDERNRLERKARRRGGPPQRAIPVGSPNEIRPGDHVLVDEGSVSGQVVDIRGRTATLSVGATRLRAELSRLRKVSSGGSAGGTRGRRHKPSGEDHDAMRALQARASLDVRGQRSVEAVPEVIRLVDDALAAGMDQVEVLHGTGTGALRFAIREALETHPAVSGYEDAPWDRGGPGITVISLR